MWAALAGLALNAGKQNKAEADKTRADLLLNKENQDNIRRENLMQSRAAVQNVDQNIMNQRGSTTQQKVFDEIMQKYNVRL